MIIKIKPDKERVKSILNLIKSREDSISILNFRKFPTVVMEMYYEILKELSSALILLDGFKATGENAHKDLINFLSKYGFTEFEISFLNDLRIKRNNSSYEGKQIEKDYLEKRQKFFLETIKKLKELIKTRI